MKEMYKGMTDSPSTTLSVAINSMDVDIYVADVSKFPAAPNVATIYDDQYTETIRYTTIDTTNKILKGCTRGLDGIARDWAQGKAIARMFTAVEVNNIIDNINELNNNKITGIVSPTQPDPTGLPENFVWIKK